MSNFEELSKDTFRINEHELMEYHGYSGISGKLKLRINYLRSWLHHSLAFHSTHSGFAIKMQRLRGVKIGKNSIISSGSVVSQDIPDYCVVVGNPARIVKKIDH